MSRWCELIFYCFDDDIIGWIYIFHWHEIVMFRSEIRKLKAQHSQSGRKDHVSARKQLTSVRRIGWIIWKERNARKYDSKIRFEDTKQTHSISFCSYMGSNSQCCLIIQCFLGSWSMLPKRIAAHRIDIQFRNQINNSRFISWRSYSLYLGFCCHAFVVIATRYLNERFGICV